MSGSGVKTVYLFGGFVFDLQRRLLLRGEQEISLTPKEFLTLQVLVEASGEAMPRETLMAAVWPDTAVGDTSLARNISALRRHLGAGAIEAVPKFGYRFILPVTQAGIMPPEPPRPEATETADTPGGGEAYVSAARRLRRRRLWTASAAGLAAVAGLGFWSMDRLLAAVPTWRDPQTGLIWARQDNARDVDREQAVAYCAGLRLAGHADWRLLTIAEVQTLYDPSLSEAGTWGQGGKSPRPVYWHVKGKIILTGGTQASDLTFDGQQEQSYDFSYGRRNFDPPDFRWDHRALCVRP